MNPILTYLLQVIAISGLLYGYYHLALRNKKFHWYNRFYLLAAMLVSILLPFLNIPVYFTQQEADHSFVWKTLSVLAAPGEAENIIISSTIPATKNWFTFTHISYLIYAIVALIFILRILFSLLRIRRIINSHTVEPLGSIHFVNTNEPGTPFSFFRWLFWNKKIDLQSEKGEQIFKHELFHIEQKHSADIIFTELLTVIFWFNPFFHLMKRELKAIHEFLADQYAVTENKQWEYAELLLMQALNTQTHLVNPFFHNQIKRRIAMITTSQKPRYQYLRKLLVLPLAVIVAALFAFSYKSITEKPLTTLKEKVTVIIDAGHGGTDAGAMAADGTTEKELTLAIAKKVKELNQDSNINIILTRAQDSYPSLHGRSDMANEINADLFLSIHINSAENKLADKQNGFEVFISNKNKTFYPENKILGGILLNYFSNHFSVDAEIKQRPVGIWVLDNSPCPAALIECGYLSNKKDLEYIKKDANQTAMAKSILASIDQYFMQSRSDDWQERKKIAGDTSSTINKLLKNYEKQNGGKTLQVIKNPVTNQQLVIESDTIIFKKNSSDYKAGLDEVIYIFNGERKNATYFEKNIVTAKRMIYYDKNEISAINKYGSDAKNGVIVFENARLENIPATNDLKQDTVPAKDNKVFDKVEVEAKFPGGNAAWRNYLEKNLDPSIPLKNKAPKGIYTTIIQFIVNLDGSVSNVKAITKHGYGMEEQAIELITKSPKWEPAVQNGHIVTSYRKQPITFQITGNEKNKEAVVNGYSNLSAEKATAKKDALATNMQNEVVVVGYPTSDGDTIPASFPGGDEKWRKYLTMHLNSNGPVDSGAPSGTYTCKVQFLVHENGTITDVKSLTKHGYGMDEQLLNLIKKGPRWEAATVNGKPITAYRIQPVTFQVTEDIDDKIITNNSSKTTAELKNITPHQLLQLPENVKIVSYAFTIDLDNSDVVVSPNNGNNFNLHTKRLLQNATKNRLITVDNIIVEENGHEKKLPAKVYKVVS